jgi:hypothetical protein
LEVVSAWLIMIVAERQESGQSSSLILAMDLNVVTANAGRRNHLDNHPRQIDAED